MKGYVHSYETLATLDGPGLRNVVFLSGCPMRCKYCHNADMFCSSVGTLTEAAEVVTHVLRYDSYIRRGGVTLSGGEPLFQSEFAAELLSRFKAVGLHTALDTAGSVFTEASKKCIDLADLVILDIKHTDEGGFYGLTGFSQENLLKNLEYIKKTGKRFWVRQVIVKGITDDEKEVLKLAEMGKGADRIELLAYHTMGRRKWETAGLEYPLEGVPETPSEVVEELQRKLDAVFVARPDDEDGAGDFGV